MNKLERKLLIKSLATKRKMTPSLKKTSKSADDFIAYIDPSDNDIQDELHMMDGFKSMKRK